MKLPRTEERRKMFLAATLGVGDSIAQCRIRNMTQFGALVESNSTIPIGTTAIIARGELSVTGEVKWSRSTHFGMKFHDLINIQNWLCEPSTSPRPVLRKSVENAVQWPVKSTIQEKSTLDTQTINRRISEELLYISRIVDETGLVLVKDPVLRIRHATSLQQLDLSQQMLSEIAQIVTLDDKLDCISQVATGSMRGRLLRANLI